MRVINTTIPLKKNAKIANSTAVNAHHMIFVQLALIHKIMNYQMGNALKNVMRDIIMKTLLVYHVILLNVGIVFILINFARVVGAMKFYMNINVIANVQQEHLILKMEVENV